MSMTDLGFLFVFLPAALLIYLLPGRRVKETVLLTVSLFFYASGSMFHLVLIILLTGMDLILGTLRSFLKAGVMDDGLVSPTEEGVPQGGPLSPVLSNIYLDKLDKELEARGLAFVRYADDFVSGQSPVAEKPPLFRYPLP